MLPQVHHTVAPALAGHAFQQTALVGMLPVLAERLHLNEAQIGFAVAAGMIAAAVALPFLGLRTGRRLLRLSILGLFGSSLALIVLIATAPPRQLAWMLPVLVAIRTVQGVSAGALLITAQQASLAEAVPLGGVARTQSFAGLGRLFGALLIGPLLLLAPVAPLLPAALGGLLALARSASLAGWDRARERMAAPVPRMLVTPVIVQAATGAAQIGLAPLLAHRLAVGAEVASGYAGLCLAAANLGLLATHRWITRRLEPAAVPVVRRLCPFGMAAAALLLPLGGHVVASALLSAVVGGASALLLALNLTDAMTARPNASGQASAWNASVQIGALAVGVGLGSLVMPLSPAAPFLLSAALALALVLVPNASRRIPQ